MESRLRRMMELFKGRMEEEHFRVVIMHDYKTWGQISVTVYEKDSKASYKRLTKLFLKQILAEVNLVFAANAIGIAGCQTCGGPGKAYYSDANAAKRFRRKKFSVRLSK